MDPFAFDSRHFKQNVRAKLVFVPPVQEVVSHQINWQLLKRLSARGG